MSCEISPFIPSPYILVHTTYDDDRIDHEAKRLSSRAAQGPVTPGPRTRVTARMIIRPALILLHRDLVIVSRSFFISHLSSLLSPPSSTPNDVCHHFYTNHRTLWNQASHIACGYASCLVLPPEDSITLSSVGMNVAAGPELAAAVTNAGGLGVIGGHGYTPKVLRLQVRILLRVQST